MADVSQTLGLSRMRPSEPKARILLVDDTPANLLSLRALLDGLGQNLVEAHSGEEAIERVKAEDLQQCAVVLAAFAYHAAVRAERIPLSASKPN